MTVYGVKVLSDILFPVDFRHGARTRGEVSLSSHVAPSLRSAVTCGFSLYRAHGRRVFLYSDRVFEDNVPGQPWCYEVQDTVRFYWRTGEASVGYELLDEGTPDRLAFWFVHLFFPFYLTLERRYEFLHAGAVAVDGKPILFLAPSMGGKSTMTDFFIRRGHALVSDDKVATFRENGRFTVAGSHPYHRPYREFETLGRRAERFMTEFLPIHACYLLERVQAEVAVSIGEVRGFHKVDAILPHFLFRFPFLKEEHFRFLTSLLDDIRLFRITVPGDLHRLGEVHDAVCAHIGRFE